MVGMERLRLLIRWGNALGVVPFRMELDPDTGTFRRFNFSWKHPATWWLVVSFFLLAFLSATSIGFFVTIVKMLGTEDIPTLVFVALASTMAVYSSYLILPYLLLSRWKDLAAAVKHVRKFDGIAGNVGKGPCQTRLRTLFGFACACVMVRPLVSNVERNHGTLNDYLLRRYRPYWA